MYDLFLCRVVLIAKYNKLKIFLSGPCESYSEFISTSKFFKILSGPCTILTIDCFHYRLVPHLYYDLDHPQHDPIISAAKDESDSLLFPILHEFSMDPPPLVQGLVPPYHFKMLQEINPTVESALSRIVQLLMHQLLISQSRYMTVCICSVDVLFLNL